MDNKIEDKKITDLIPDSENANLGTERGLRALDDSLTSVGLGRSVVTDKHGHIIAGNKTVERAADRGFEDAIVVHTTGDKLVVVQRDDLDLSDSDPNNNARKLAFFDNRVAELDLSWNPVQLQADKEASVEIVEKLWSPVELGILAKGADAWNPPLSEDAQSLREVLEFGISSFWKDLSRENEVSKYFLPLLKNEHMVNDPHNTVKTQYSRTNATATERIVKTYMRPGDIFYELCCGWMTFSSTAKYFGFGGKGGDIWDKSIAFCEKQLKVMAGDGVVSVGYADCRDTKEPPNTYDLVHSNPPFFNLEEYGDSSDDLASVGSYQLWLDAMGAMAREAERILKPGGIANFVINDFRQDKKLVLMHADFINSIMANSNLALHDIVVAEVISQSQRMWRTHYDVRRTAKCHEYIITFKKPERK